MDQQQVRPTCGAPRRAGTRFSLEFQDGAYAALFRGANQASAAGSQAQTEMRAT
jgi:hypothetical protein